MSVERHTTLYEQEQAETEAQGLARKMTDTGDPYYERVTTTGVGDDSNVVVHEIEIPAAYLLEQAKEIIRRHVVIGDLEADAVALWVAHSYVYDCAPATPYLHPYSPEPGSGKTTLLDVLSVLAHDAVQADNLTEAVLFRLIDSKHPTLLFDEVDAVFGKKNSDSTEGIRQVLNSGYRKGKQAFRCVPPTHEVVGFDVFCPKATAGLRELPDTLAHRSIPIAMKPPLPTDEWVDFDYEEIAEEADALRRNFTSWAEQAEAALCDPRLKPEKLPELDARGNEIWRILFRIADLAGQGWPARSRTAAIELSGGHRVRRDGSAAVQLLSHVRDLFTGDRITCRALVEALNASDELPYGGWNSGAGINTRELGRKIAPFEIHAKPIRIDGQRAGNGYERAQFEDAWNRYLPGNAPQNRYTGTTRMVEPDSGDSEPVQERLVPVGENGVNPHEKRDVPVVPLSNAEVRRLLDQYRPELVGRNDITTPNERREIALMLALEERAA